MTSVWTMLLPLPGIAPAMLPAGESAKVHVKVVFTMLLENASPVVPLEHMTCDGGEEDAIGKGNIVMVMQFETSEQITPFRL